MIPISPARGERNDLAEQLDFAAIGIMSTNFKTSACSSGGACARAIERRSLFSATNFARRRGRKLAITIDGCAYDRRNTIPAGLLERYAIKTIRFSKAEVIKR